MVKHPGLRIDLRLDDRVVDLALEGIDVAIRVGVAPPNTTELVAQGLCSFHRVLVASLPPWKTDAVGVHAVYRTAHRGAGRIRALIAHLREAYAPSQSPPGSAT